jgi:hypothetical protein
MDILGFHSCDWSLPGFVHLDNPRNSTHGAKTPSRSLNTWMLIPKTQTILQHKAKRVRNILQKEGLHDRVTAKDSDEHTGLATHLKTTLMRPIRFLFTEPIILLSAIYNGYLFGIVCMFNGFSVLEIYIEPLLMHTPQSFSKDHLQSFLASPTVMDGIPAKKG